MCALSGCFLVFITVKMADVTAFPIENMDFSKLKVPDLKKELKARGLSTTGNKTELLARLQGVAKCKLDDTIGMESVDDLDEDLLNDDDDEHLDTSESVIHELDTAMNVSEKSGKRKINLNTENHNDESGPPKKIVLDRNPSLCSESSQKQNGVESEDTDMKTTVAVPEKKVIKLSELSVKERLEMRAKKFGVEITADAKKVARSERFGATPATSSTSTVKLGGSPSVNLDVLQKRAERFGGSVSSVMSSLEKQQQLEKRKQRFGVTNGSISQSDKAKQRLERFKQPVK